MPRWEIFPPSDGFESDAVGVNSTAGPIMDAVPASRSREALLMQIGEFLRQGRNEQNRITCSYRNLTDPEYPIRLICELGCCPTGCCAFDEYSQRSWSTIDYSWALLLLAVFIACVIASSLIMAFLYCFNRRRRHRVGNVKANDADTAYGSECGTSSGYHLDFGSAYSQASTSSQVSPHIYRCDAVHEQYNLPSFYPTAQTFKSVL